jgi:hypothetical protein
MIEMVINVKIKSKKMLQFVTFSMMNIKFEDGAAIAGAASRFCSGFTKIMRLRLCHTAKIYVYIKNIMVTVH